MVLNRQVQMALILILGALSGLALYMEEPEVLMGLLFCLTFLLVTLTPKRECGTTSDVWA